MFNKTKTIEKLAKAVVEAALSLCVCECRWYSFHYHLAAKWEREANSERTNVDDLWQLVAQLGASSRFSFCLHFALRWCLWWHPSNTEEPWSHCYAMI